ncbi:MAG: hypothetical protein IJ181_12455 [Acidaminococcaceae bacterium]|nr:hypothetical protein [Acidaminococcaceae bacterium]
MNMEALKKALLQGIPSGIVSWLIYGLIFKLLIEKESFKDALFDKDSLIFLAIVTVFEIIVYYIINARKTKDA